MSRPNWTKSCKKITHFLYIMHAQVNRTRILTVYPTISYYRIKCLCTNTFWPALLRYHNKLLGLNNMIISKEIISWGSYKSGKLNYIQKLFQLGFFGKMNLKNQIFFRYGSFEYFFKVPNNVDPSVLKGLGPIPPLSSNNFDYNNNKCVFWIRLY